MRMKIIATTALAASAQAFDSSWRGRDHKSMLRRAQGTTVPTLTDDAMCLGLENHQGQNNQPVVLQPCANAQTAKWRLTNGALQTGTNMCLDVPDGHNQNGQPLQIYTCYAGNTNQQWQRRGNQLQWGNTDKCLDVTDGCFGSGAELQLWQCFDDNTNQAFNLSLLEAPLASVSVGQSAAATTRKASPSKARTGKTSTSKAPSPQPTAVQAASGAVTGAGSFSGYSYISFDAFLALHPVLNPLRQDILDAAASVNIGLPPILLAAQALQESSGNPQAPNGGLGQFQNPDTWAKFGGGDMYNGRDSLFAMARYLTFLLESHNNDLTAVYSEYSGGLSFYAGDIRRWLNGEYVYGAGT